MEIFKDIHHPCGDDINENTYFWSYEKYYLQNGAVAGDDDISAQKWYKSYDKIGIFSYLFYKLSKEKQLFDVNSPFMLYMPLSNQFMQKKTSKDKERSSWTKWRTLSRPQDAFASTMP
jgi:hypothetical protein